ncbi:hypothetical protein [Haloglycomyces albus]|uniref:hypothetical protein n=1 Tax=Haloglycomyces albus TaxID=526067 RepID=UPI0004B25424|nr:hypothetical protein [Haloglycomyces albus]
MSISPILRFRQKIADILSPRNADNISVSKPLAESKIRDDGDKSSLRYARGYLLTHESAAKPVRHWRQIALGNYHFTYDPRLPFALAERRGTFVIILGIAVDLETWASTEREIAQLLLNSRTEGRENFNRRLDMLSGRYVVIDGDEDTFHIQGDAAGMRAIFYSERPNGACVGSHAHLVASYVGAAYDAHFRDPQALKSEFNAYALPGRATAFTGVYTLTPNTELNILDGSVRRIYPRRELEQNSLKDVVETVGSLMTNQLRHLAARTPLIVSVTAGLDSRTTLAMTREISQKAQYFTYVSRGAKNATQASEARDVEVSQQIAQRFNLSHTLIELPSRFPAEPLNSIMRDNSARSSYPGIGPAHRDAGFPNGLHIRSNLYEVGRAFFRAKRPYMDKIDALEMTKMLTGRKSDDEKLVKSFEEYIDTTDFNVGQRFCNPFDLFYWEHRCGVWLNAHLTESDVAYDTFTLVNSRFIFEKLLSVPEEDRLSGQAFISLITEQWPEMLDIPINGKFLGPRGDN